MRLKIVCVLAAGCALALMGSAAVAAPKAKLIILKGCAHYQVPFCTVLGNYSLIDATPPVPVNVGVTVWGTKAGDVGPCFHPSLKVVRWSRNRLRCPL